MAAQVAGSRVALGLGAVGKHGIEVAQRAKAVDFFREVREDSSLKPFTHIYMYVVTYRISTS